MKSYQYISEQILRGNKVDIKGNISYLFVFLFETTRELLETGDYRSVISQISQLQRLYGEHSKLSLYCDSSTFDTLLCMGSHEERLPIIQQIVDGTTTVYTGEMLINLKYKFGGKAQAKDLLCIADRLTSYGKENINDILRIMNVLPDEAYNHDQFDIVGEIVKEGLEKSFSKGELHLFSGNPYSYELNKNPVNYDLKKNYIYFSNDPKFISFIEELSRVSENMLIESRGLPRVNEGWINETKLYYSIKKAFPQYKVIHQYRCKWLGLQSLDIFIKELSIGIEYQGIQHMKPIDFFGGESAFIKTQLRDRKKKMLCEKNKIKLIYAYENYNLQDVIEEINLCISQNEQSAKIQINTLSSSASNMEKLSMDLKVLLNASADDKAMNEKSFLDSFCAKLEHENFNLSHLKWKRLSDKTLNITYNGCQIGRINLFSRKTKMQILSGEVKWIENQSLSTYIQEQNKWIEYLKTLSLS